MMNDFIKQVLENHDYHSYIEVIEFWKNSNEFFLIQEYDKEILQSNVKKNLNFFTCEQTDKLVYEFEKIQNPKIKKNTSLFITVKVDNLEEEYNKFKNITMKIEEDEYYFRKYVIFYTEDGLSKLEPCTKFLLKFIQSDDEKSENESSFDKFENEMFFDDAYFIAMQLIIKLPFISLPHSNDRFEVIEDRIKTRIEREGLIDKEKQVDQILYLLDENKIGEQSGDEINSLLDRLDKILGDFYSEN
jgi:hypothetical protein